MTRRQGVPAILLVEDNDADAMLWDHALEELAPGTAVHVVHDGEDAWRLMLERQRAGSPFQLIVSDLNLPMLCGRQLLARVRAEPTLAGTPVVLVTGSLAPGAPPQECSLHEKPMHYSEFKEFIALLIARHPGAFAPLSTGREQ